MKSAVSITVGFSLATVNRTVGPSARVDAILPKTLKWKGGLDSKVMTMGLRRISLSMSWLVSGAGQIGQPLTTLAKVGSLFAKFEDNQNQNTNTHVAKTTL